MTEGQDNSREQIADQARFWIVRMASGEMSAQDLDSFRIWREADPAHNLAFEDARRLWRALPAPSAVLAAPRRPERRRTVPRIDRKRAGALTGIAAALALVVFTGPELRLMLRADHRTGVEVQNVALPDGSVAMLDARSAIAIHYDSGERRIELLRGDAWFRVAHGDRRPFRVTARGGTTEDVGTAFEVREEGDGATVAVSEGRVRVATDPVAAFTPLTVTQRVRYREGGPVTRLPDVAVTDIAAWRDGEVLINNADIRSAVARIARYHSGPVLVFGSTGGTRRVSGVFRTDRSDEAIDSVAATAGLRVQRFAGLTLLHRK